MVQKITKGILVSVETEFDGVFRKDVGLHYAFKYTIMIENTGSQTVQLISRFWEIKDALNATQIVEGEGVVGKKPILTPGEKHIYSSGCLLMSPIGAMGGYYRMVNFETKRLFKVKVPTFKLNAPFAMN